jgi:hypothetical protein
VRDQVELLNHDVVRRRRFEGFGELFRRQGLFKLHV